MNIVDARAIWAEAIERIKDKTSKPTFWRALERSQGVAIEGDVFVIGFASPDYPQAGHLRSSENRIVIERVLSEMLGRTMTIKLIEGKTLADYEYVKKQEAAAEAAHAARQRQKYEERRMDLIWEEIADQVTRMYASLGKMRSFPQVRAKYLADAFKVISDAMDEIYPDEPDELTERAAARVFEKLAVLVDAHPTVLAYELFRFRESRK